MRLDKSKERLSGPTQQEKLGGLVKWYGNSPPQECNLSKISTFRLVERKLSSQVCGDTVRAVWGDKQCLNTLSRW